MKTTTLTVLSAVLFALFAACGDNSSPLPEPTDEAGLPISTDNGVPSYSDGGSLPLCKIYTDKCSVVQTFLIKYNAFQYDLTCPIDPDDNVVALLMFFYPATGAFKVPCAEEHQCLLFKDSSGVVHGRGADKTNWKTTYVKMGIKVFVRDHRVNICKANFVELPIQ